MFATRFYLQLLLVFPIRVICNTFDYIIVGAGTAGLVVGNRLSANPNVTVVLIEPGPDVRIFPGVQAAFPPGAINASIDWAYTSIPQPRLNNRTFQYHAGRAIGGSSDINVVRVGMQYIRGDAAQYDAWEALGNEGWNFSTLFPNFKLSENFTIPTDAQVAAGATSIEKFHGHNGNLVTGYPYLLSNGSFHDLARETWEKLDVPVNKDLNGGDTRGFALFPSTLDRDANVREDAARAYYQPVEDRPNLSIINGTVTRITWAECSDQLLVADGVEYIDAAGTLSKIEARLEVILSAGSFKSPVILESSGVGNPRIPDEHRIETKLELPGVGESMQNHHPASFSFTINNNITGQAPYVAYATASDIFGDNTTAVAASSSLLLTSWAQTASAATGGALSPEALEMRYRILHDLIFIKNVTITEQSYAIAPNSSVVNAGFRVSEPLSLGSIHLGFNSSQPIVNPNPLSINLDLQLLTGAGRLTQKLWATQPLLDTIISETELSSNATDDEWNTFLTASLNTAYHVVGTCAMLPRESGGVVDPELKVYGTQNVRIVDASIIPILMSGHSGAAVYAVAEMASEIIKTSQA
ncbi:Glucose oxidase [Lachnellula willkommii]|uniref:Glucose oxidase n=1 Tax=Lachnellula willkommii TaxID=215461 RepID=A0A559MCR7_9HELO|nr:Glucose oxidase [Lachnellula willkommii]